MDDRTKRVWIETHQKWHDVNADANEYLVEMPLPRGQFWTLGGYEQDRAHGTGPMGWWLVTHSGVMLPVKEGPHDQGTRHMTGGERKYHGRRNPGSEEDDDGFECGACGYPWPRGYEGPCPDCGVGWDEPIVIVQKESGARRAVKMKYKHCGLNADWCSVAIHRGPGAEPNRYSGDYYAVEDESSGDWLVVQRFYEEHEGNDTRDEVISSHDTVDEAVVAADKLVAKARGGRSAKKSLRKNPPQVWRDSKHRKKSIFSSLRPIAVGYVEAAMWSSNDHEGKSISEHYTIEDFDKDTLATMVDDANTFLINNADDLEGYEEERAGNDFWYTRNGYGVGFWDGSYEEPAATRLTKAAKAFGEFSLYGGDDGKIYGVG